MTEAKSVDRGPKYIPLKDILDNLALTHNIVKTAKILQCSKQNISQRLMTAHIDINEYKDFKEIKDVRYEVLQARLVNSIDAVSIKKAPLGSKVLAICQLEDKIRVIRGQSTGKLELDAVLLGVHARIFPKVPQDIVVPQDMVCVDNATDNTDDADKSLINNDNRE